MYHIIANGKSTKGKRAKYCDIIRSVFDRAGKAYTFYFTQRPGQAKELAKELTEKGETHIIAMGGDGTLHEILNGVQDPSKLHLGVIPMGTGNDFATSVGIPKDVKKAAEIIAFKAARHIDYIELACGLRSINALGFGMDVEILKRAYKSRDNSRTKYMRAFLKVLFTYKSHNFVVRYQEREEHHYGLIAAVGNGKQIGGGIQLFPDAKVDDGYLDLLIVDYLSFGKTLKAFIKLMKGKIDSIKEVTKVRVKEVTFIPETKHYTLQAEGELYNDLPMKAHIVTESLRFYLP
jgi:YegS/Rv2252/BmrU family lipid kinase